VLERERCRLDSIWRQAWTNLAVRRQGREAKLIEQFHGVDLHCRADAFRVEQVFRNVFENALAACRDPVEIVVSAKETVLDARLAVLVSVSDNGPGLSAEQAAHLRAVLHDQDERDGPGHGDRPAHRRGARRPDRRRGRSGGGGSPHLAEGLPMTRPLRIAVADDEPDMRDYFSRILPLLGHRVVVAAADGEELVEKCLVARPDLVITDVKMPRLDGIDAAVRLYEQAPVPVILVSAYHGGEAIDRAVEDHVMAYLVKPIKQADLAPAIALATHRFAQFEQLRQEAADLKQALGDRRLIEQAKGVLMAKEPLDEPSAFGRLQQLAGDGSLKLVEVARAVVDGGGSHPA